jgi:hypothetical protein
MALKEEEIEKKVILLKLLTKEDDESIDEALASLADTKMATLEEIKKLYKELQDSGYISDNGSLTMLGVTEAQKAKQEFTLENR